MCYYEKISADRLYLSPVREEDVPIYLKWLNDRSVTDGLGNTAQVIGPRCEAEWLKKADGEYQFGIVKREGGVLIGNCGFDSVSLIHRTAQAGIFIGDEENRSCGYGEEALGALVDFGFQVLGLRSVMLQVFSFNERAVRCYQKVGFQEFGRRRQCYYLDGKYYDSIQMDLLREERQNLLSAKPSGIKKPELVNLLK